MQILFLLVMTGTAVWHWNQPYEMTTLTMVFLNLAAGIFILCSRALEVLTEIQKTAGHIEVQISQLDDRLVEMSHEEDSSVSEFYCETGND